MAKPLAVEDLESAMRFMASRNLYLWHESDDGPPGWVFTVGGRRESRPTELRATVLAAATKALDDVEKDARERMERRSRESTRDRSALDAIGALRG